MFNRDKESPVKSAKSKKVKITEAVSVRVPNDFFKAHIKNVFKRNKKLVNLIYSGQQVELLFIDSILVPPNKFRPMNKVRVDYFEIFGKLGSW